MPNGLKFQRKHRFWGYKLKYLYYCIARRDVLQKKKSFGEYNENKIIYLIKPDYQDGVEGLLSLIHKQVIYIDYAKQKGYIPYVDWKNYMTQYYNGIDNVWEYFFVQPSEITEEEVYSCKNVYLSIRTVSYDSFIYNYDGKDVLSKSTGEPRELSMRIWTKLFRIFYMM